MDGWIIPFTLTPREQYAGYHYYIYPFKSLYSVESAAPIVRLPSWRATAKPSSRLDEVQHGLDRFGPRGDVWLTFLTFVGASQQIQTLLNASPAVSSIPSAALVASSCPLTSAVPSLARHTRTDCHRGSQISSRRWLTNYGPLW